MNMSHESFFQDGSSLRLDIARRLRRMRKSSAIRSLVQETDLLSRHLVQPVFVTEGPTKELESIPTIFSYQLGDLLQEVENILSSGICAINLLCHITAANKDPHGSYAFQSSSLLTRSIKAIKSSFPELLIIVDISLEPFTDHGHDGWVDSEGHVLNDITCSALGKIALLACEAGADFIAPSSMMDGKIRYLRNLLDDHGFTSTGIISYAVKYASSLYNPFCDAIGSQRQPIDRRGYQVNPANAREALLECQIDEAESADSLLIKPALFSLDILSKVRQQTLLPLGAYQVSGEWAMIYTAGQRGFIDPNKVLIESLQAIRRAGADFIITYGAKQAAQEIRKFLP